MDSLEQTPLSIEKRTLRLADGRYIIFYSQPQEPQPKDEPSCQN